MYLNNIWIKYNYIKFTSVNTFYNYYETYCSKDNVNDLESLTVVFITLFYSNWYTNVNSSTVTKVQRYNKTSESE